MDAGFFYDAAPYIFFEDRDTNRVKEKQEVKNMTNLSEIDIQNLRHLIMGCETNHCKMQEYAQKATDPKVQQFFQKSAESAMQSKQQLLQFLQ